MQNIFKQVFTKFSKGSGSMSTTGPSASAAKLEGNLPPNTWQQTMIRVKDINKSLNFYQKLLGLTLVCENHFAKDMGDFSLYFLASVPKDHPEISAISDPKSDAAKHFLWGYDGVTIELTHNHGTESQDEFKYHPGNTEDDAFVSLGFATRDLSRAASLFDSHNLAYKDIPNSGFEVTDPDGYKVEIFQRTGNYVDSEFVIAQTHLKVSDVKKSSDFYSNLCDMTVVKTDDTSDEVVHYLATLPKESNAPTKVEELYGKNVAVLKLTQVKGNEKKEYRSGNQEPHRGFGHTGFLVPDTYKFTDVALEKGVKFQKKPDDGRMKGIAFALDPDGYWVEIIKRKMDGKF